MTAFRFLAEKRIFRRRNLAGRTNFKKVKDFLQESEKPSSQPVEATAVGRCFRRQIATGRVRGRGGYGELAKRGNEDGGGRRAGLGLAGRCLSRIFKGDYGGGCSLALIFESTLFTIYADA